MRICLNLLGVSIASGVLFKIFEVKNLVGEVRCYQNVNVEIDIAQHAPVKTWGLVHVAIIVLQLAIRIAEAKDVVPAIEPVILSADRSRRDRTEQIVFDLVFENSVEDQQRSVDPRYSCRPTSMLETIILEHADEDVTFVHLFS